MKQIAEIIPKLATKEKIHKHRPQNEIWKKANPKYFFNRKHLTKMDNSNFHYSLNFTEIHSTFSKE